MRINLNNNKMDFHIDSLESRRMLAGDVSIQLNNAGDISITGDAEANEFTLDSDDGSGGTDLVITGANGTTISFNGSTAASQTIALDTPSSIGRNLRINTRGGDDIINIKRNQCPWYLASQLGLRK